MVVDVFASEITGESGDDYFVEFHDSDMEVVEANTPKSEFVWLPHPVKIGSRFGIVLFRLKENPGLSIAVWPVLKFWHQSLRENSRRDQKK